MQLAVLKTYLKHNERPKILVHNLDIFSFVLTRKKEIYDPGFYQPYLGEDALYDALSRIDPDVWKWKHVPLYGYAIEDMRFTWMRGLMRVAGVNPHEDVFLGYNPRDKEWTGDFEAFRKSNPSGIRIEIEPEGIVCLEELIQTCCAKGIKVVLVYSPEYCEMQSLTRNRKEIFDRFKQIAARYDVSLWDFSQSELCERKDCFSNSQHMNQRGATLFSQMLGKQLADLLQKEQHNIAGATLIL
jgi:hypothetical protein